MTGSIYIMQEDEKTRCALCSARCTLLIKKSGQIDNKNPAFYICFKCGTTAQVGKGFVKTV